MANGRSPGRAKPDSSRVPGGFIALPWSVLDSPAYGCLSHPARALLLEIARQYVSDNNGRLLASRAYLLKRGWKSNDVISRALRQLIDGKFVHQTVQGHRPNKASWYAVTWYVLDKMKGYDEGANLLFRRGSYLDGAPLTPSRGIDRRSIALPHGTEHKRIAPADGAVSTILTPRSTPSHGHHLEVPSAGCIGRAEATLDVQVKYRPFTPDRLVGIYGRAYTWERKSRRPTLTKDAALALLALRQPLKNVRDTSSPVQTMVVT